MSISRARGRMRMGGLCLLCVLTASCRDAAPPTEVLLRFEPGSEAVRSGGELVRVEVGEVVVQLDADWPVEVLLVPGDGVQDAVWTVRAWALRSASSEGPALAAARVQGQYIPELSQVVQVVLEEDFDEGLSELPEINTSVSSGRVKQPTSTSTPAADAPGEGAAEQGAAEQGSGAASFEPMPQDGGAFDAAALDPAALDVCSEACEDGIDCTVESCQGDVCEHRPQHSRCEPGDFCAAGEGCVMGAACGQDGDCPAEDACTVSHCDTVSARCVWDLVDGDLDGELARECGGQDCDDARVDVSSAGIESCNGVDDDCDGALDEDVSCGAGATCTAGECRCAGGLSACGDGALVCADLASDSAHCGACGEACSGAEVCVASQCQCDRAGWRECEGACVELSSSARNCGSCGRACDVRQACVSDSCETCGGPGQACCQPDTDMGTGFGSSAWYIGADGCETGQNCVQGLCGACGGLGEPCCVLEPATGGQACGDNLQCTGVAGEVGANCAPAEGAASCGGYVHDLSTDLEHCGGCDRRCPGVGEGGGPGGDLDLAVCVDGDCRRCDVEGAPCCRTTFGSNSWLYCEGQQFNGGGSLQCVEGFCRR